MKLSKPKLVNNKFVNFKCKSGAAHKGCLREKHCCDNYAIIISNFDMLSICVNMVTYTN